VFINTLKINRFFYLRVCRKIVVQIIRLQNTNNLITKQQLVGDSWSDQAKIKQETNDETALRKLLYCIRLLPC